MSIEPQPPQAQWQLLGTQAPLKQLWIRENGQRREIEQVWTGATPHGSQGSVTTQRLQQQPTNDSVITEAIKHRSRFILKSYPNSS